jgi:single-strand DNA-binding protein
MNKIAATGRVVADAELRFTPSGDPIANFRLASDVGFGDKKTTNWFSCQIWGKRGEALAPHLTKGQQVTVFGQLTLREWTNKDGVKALSPDIRIDEIELQGGKQSSAQAPGAAPQQEGGRFSNIDDAIPF